MSPYFPIYCFTDSGTANFQASSYRRDAFSIFRTLAEFSNIFLGQLGIVMQRSWFCTKRLFERKPCMPNLVGRRSPFQIRDCVVALDSVLVVDGEAWGARADKRLGNKNCDAKTCDSSRRTKTQSSQSVFACGTSTFENLSYVGSSSSRIASDSTHIRDGIVRILLDCSPFFNHTSDISTN